MQLKLKELQKVANKVISDEKKFEAFKSEISNCVGPTVLTTHGIKLMAESANDYLDVLERVGKKPLDVDVNVLLQHANSKIPAVRKLIVRLLPESHVKRFMFDADATVRSAAAQKLNSIDIKRMLAKAPHDDQLVSIYRQKKLQEEKDDQRHFDMYGDHPLGQTYDDVEHPGLTDEWYNSLAHKIINGMTPYGNNLEGNWEEKVVDRLCNSYKSQGIEIDYKKLIDSVYKHMDERGKASIAANENRSIVLKTIVESLRDDYSETPVMPILSENSDPVDELLSTRLSVGEFINVFEEMFSVRKDVVTNPGKNVGINENFSRVRTPVDAVLPTGYLRSNDEKALNTYIKYWNSQRELRQQPYRLSWYPSHDKVNFNLRLK